MENNNFIDVHCHLEMIENTGKAIENAKKAGVLTIVTQGVNIETNRKSLELSSKYDIVKSALGLYPIDSLKMSTKEIDDEIDFIRKNKGKIVAIGEVGLDFKETEDRKEQVKAFEKMVNLSIELDKPIIVHSRKAELECIEILEKYKAKKVIMHCFSGKLSLVKRIVDNKWRLSIPTSVKRSEHFQKIIEMTPIEQLFCETDAPYLHPDKKWPNEPALVIESYKKISEIKKIDLQKTKECVLDSFDNFF